MKDETRYIPLYSRQSAVQTRLERFQSMNRFVTKRGGWITSLPGAEMIRIECLPGSGLPHELASHGWNVALVDQAERILPKVTQRLGLTSGGAYVALAEGSTKAAAMVMQHDGPTAVDIFEFKFDAL